MVLVAFTVVGAVLVGLARGGRLRHLGDVRLRRPWLVAAAVAAQVLLLPLALWGASGQAAAPVLLGASQLALLAFLWANRTLPGVPIVFLGLLLNALVMTANGGMPVSREALAAVEGIAADQVVTFTPAKHQLLEPGDPLPLLADVLPIPVLRTVVSVGDIVLAGGVGVLVSNLMRPRRARTATGATRR